VVAKKQKKKVVNLSNKKLKASKQKSTKHKVIRGDTLSGISKRYRVSIRSIKQANNLKNNTLYLGKVLRIPRS